MARFLASRRGRVSGGIALLAVALYLAGSIRRVGESAETVVFDSPLFHVPPRVLRPGWRLAPLGFGRLTAYPDRISHLRFEIPRGEAPALSSSEGVAVEVVGEIAYRVPAESVLDVHRRCRGDLRNQLLLPLVEWSVLDSVRSASYTRISGAHRFELESSVATRLGPALRAERLRFVSVRVEAVRRTGGDLRGVPLAPEPNSRLLVIGLDGADWRVIDPLLARGRLPTLSRLIAGGVRARLKTIEPVLSPVIWTTAATGFLPPEHGILDFLVTNNRTGKQIPVTSRNRKVRAVWNLLGDAGVPVGVIGWWATWPAEAVDGYLVSDRVAYQLFDQERTDDGGPAGKTYPADLYRKIVPLIVRPETITDADLAPFVRLAESVGEALPARAENRLEEFRTVVAAARTYAGIAEALGSGGYQPFQAIYFEGIDTASHLFMPFHPPRRPGISEGDFRRFSGAVEAFYIYQDEVLGRLLEKAPPGTGVMILSDHGFRSERDRPVRESRIGYGTAALWHRKYGVFIASGGRFRSGATLPEVSVVDITPTILAYFGLPVGEDMQGRPVREIFPSEFLNAHPIRYRPSWETPRPAPVQIVSDPTGDRALKEKLLSLGYLSQEGTLSHNNLGNSLLSQGDVKGALREFELAVKKAPDFALVRVNLARAHLMNGDPAAARRAAEQALRLASDSPEARVILAKVEAAEGQRQRAEERLREALHLESSSAEAHKALGVLLQEQGKLEEARAHYSRALEIDPEDPEGYNNLGVIEKQEGRPEAAEIHFHRALEADPGYAGASNNLALLAMDREDWSAAERYLGQALHQAPGDPVAHNNRGNLLYQLGKLDQAEREYRRALARRPGYPEPHNGLGALLGKRGDREGAIREYRAAIGLKPDYGDARLNLANALLRVGRIVEAEEELVKTLEGDPFRVDATAALARIWLDTGRWEEVQNLTRAAIGSHPEAWGLWNLLAEASRAAGNRRAAAEAFRQSLSRNPDQPGIREQMERAERGER